MQKYSYPLPGEDHVMAWARYIVLNNLCAKPMLVSCILHILVFSTELIVRGKRIYLLKIWHLKLGLLRSTIIFIFS